jgi:GNAT superfamily N-acetyltransferase
MNNSSLITSASLPTMRACATKLLPRSMIFVKAFSDPRRGPIAISLSGFALWFYNYSTFRGRAGIYLEDLFVDDAMRGKGIGKALLKHLAQRCVKEGLPRLQWWVLDWNAPSIEFYKSLGAVPQGEWTVFRVSGDALSRLATQ